MVQGEQSAALFEESTASLDRRRADIEAALERGDPGEARRLLGSELDACPGLRQQAAWSKLERIQEWPEAWLIAAVRVDPPDEAALDALVQRYWGPLYARCRMLTATADAAADLAQEAWCRVLRTRGRLRPHGNLLAYLSVVATNVCRDAGRRARRAGPLADHRLGSLEAPGGGLSEEGQALVQLVADPRSLAAEDQALLKLAIDRALSRLGTRAREVLVARVVDGESCASIGERYGRTEQTISGWVRHALAEVRAFLGESGYAAPDGDDQ